MCEIIVKDEGERFGLKSFKVLGSSFAISMLKNKLISGWWHPDRLWQPHTLWRLR